jgi:hypothetical protein
LYHARPFPSRADRNSSGNAQIHFVIDEAGRKAFWRSAIVVAGDTLASLETYAPKAYPDLHFVKGVVNDAGKLAGGYLASRKRVQMTLATLDDWGSWAFTCPACPRAARGYAREC